MHGGNATADDFWMHLASNGAPRVGATPSMGWRRVHHEGGGGAGVAVDDMPWSGLGKANGSEGRSETGGNKCSAHAARVVPTQVMWPGRVGLRCVARAVS